MTTSLLSVHDSDAAALPYDNTVAFAASAGAVSATQAGSGDGTVLDSTNTT